MSRDVVTVSPDTTLEQVASLLETHRIKRVPVVEEGRLVGILSRANLLHGLIARPADQSVEDAAERDRRIRSEVQDILQRNAWLEHRHMNLVVSDGMVHVWGIVRSEEHRRALLMALRSIPGVAGVQDHLSPNWFTSG